jgi:hypothetical protein
MWRVKENLMGLTNIKRILVNSWKANTTVRVRRTEPNVKGKARLLNVTSAVIQTTLQRNTELSNTWFNCTKSLWRMPMELKDRMNLTSMMYPRKQLHQGLKKRTLKFPRATDKEDIDIENTIVEYNLNDVFGDLN